MDDTGSYSFEQEIETICVIGQEIYGALVLFYDTFETTIT